MDNRSIRRIAILTILMTFLVPLLSLPAYPLEKMSDAELRKVTGRSGFINSKEDLKKLESARGTFKQLVRTQGLENLLPEQTRNQLFNNDDLKPEKQARALQQATRSLLRNPKFLRQVEQAGRALVQLSKALKQLRGLR